MHRLIEHHNNPNKLQLHLYFYIYTQCDCFYTHISVNSLAVLSVMNW